MPYKRTQKGLTKWVAQVQVKGNRECCIFTTKAEAIAWEVQMRSGSGLPPKKLSQEIVTGSSVSLVKWAEDYLDYCQKFSAKVLVEKVTVFRRFFQHVVPTMLVVELKPKMVLDYLRIQGASRTGNAANKERKNLVAAWNWGVKYLDFPEKNPCRVDRLPAQKMPRYIPSEDDFWKVYAVAEGQDKVMLLAFLHLAGRKNEILRLAWDDVDFGNHRIRLWTSKRAGGDKEYDWLPMTDDLVDSLMGHRKVIEGKWVFPNPITGLPFVSRQHWMKDLCGLARVKRFDRHSIRHLSASILDAAGIELTVIQAILRHKSATTTARYLHSLRGVRNVLNDVFSKKEKPVRGGISDRLSSSLALVG